MNKPAGELWRTLGAWLVLVVARVFGLAVVERGEDADPQPVCVVYGGIVWEHYVSGCDGAWLNYVSGADMLLLNARRDDGRDVVAA